MSDRPRNRQEICARIAQGGKDEVIYEEMVRIGFWNTDQPPPRDPPDEVRRAHDLRARLAQLRDQAARLQNLAALERQLKKKRMAESLRRRAETKQRRLGERAARRAETQDAETRELTYLGAGVSAGVGPSRDRRMSDAARLTAQKLPVASTAAELAALMKLPLGQLRFLAFAREVSTTTHYRRFTIPKRDGTPRVISAPRARLKRAQHWILEHILDPIAPPIRRTASCAAAPP
jgi:RNA-directed DNA polymerase